MEGRITRSKSILKIQPQMTLKAVIEICEQHKIQKTKSILVSKKQKFLINEKILDKLVNILKPLKELENVVGLGNVKQCILEHVI